MRPVVCCVTIWSRMWIMSFNTCQCISCIVFHQWEAACPVCAKGSTLKLCFHFALTNAPMFLHWNEFWETSLAQNKDLSKEFYHRIWLVPITSCGTSWTSLWRARAALDVTSLDFTASDHWDYSDKHSDTTLELLRFTFQSLQGHLDQIVHLGHG